MSQNQQPSEEALKLRQAKMLEVWEGIKEMAKPTTDEEHAQALAFALVDMAEYVNDIEQTAADDRKFMEGVVYRANTVAAQNHNMKLLLNKLHNDGTTVRDVWYLRAEAGKFEVVRVQDDMVLGTFGKEMAEGLIAKLNSYPTIPEEVVADEQPGDRAEVPDQG